MDGKIKGKGTGGLRSIETRLRILSISAPKYSFVVLDKINDRVSEKLKSCYWRQVAKKEGRELERCASMAKISLQNELMPYPQKIEVLEYQSKENLVGSRAKTRIATVALLAAMGLSFFTGSYLTNHANKKIIREKDSRIEQLVQENQKPRMMILTDLPSEELDKRYEKYAADEKTGKIPILDLRYSAREDANDGVEYYTNKGHNKGIFVKGFMYSTNKMQVPPENKKYTPEKKAELNKRFSNIDEKVRKEQKRFEQGIKDVVTLKHPLSGLWKTFTGFFGQLNGAARGFARPIAYFLTRNDKIDRAIDDFGDASYFGDSYNELHENIFGLEFQKTKNFIKKHPVKSTISITEGILLWKWLHGHGDESSDGIWGGGSGSPGRSGGAGTP